MSDKVTVGLSLECPELLEGLYKITGISTRYPAPYSEGTRDFKLQRVGDLRSLQEVQAAALAEQVKGKTPPARGTWEERCMQLEQEKETLKEMNENQARMLNAARDLYQQSLEKVRSLELSAAQHSCEGKLQKDVEYWEASNCDLREKLRQARVALSSLQEVIE